MSSKHAHATPRRRPRHCRPLRFEWLENRRLLAGEILDPDDLLASPGDVPAGEAAPTPSIYPLEEIPISGDTRDKPQSKVWSHDDLWWTVTADFSGTWVRRLDGLTWTPVLNLSAGRFYADVKPLGDVAHILLDRESTAYLASVEYVPGDPGTYRLWSERPALSVLSLHADMETATIDVDSTGRMWVASDARTDVEVRYSDFPYATWSAPIIVAQGINSDDICAISAMPDGSVGVLWSDQVTERFGFRVHYDGDAPESWSADEVPASQSALDVGGGMADDHLNVAVASDGTLYAAIKTSYDTTGFTQVGLLVRRPTGIWDPLYEVDTGGTRPIVVLSEVQDRLLVIYREFDTLGPIVYRESSLSSIAFGPKQTLIPGPSVNNVSSIKHNFTDQLVAIAAGDGMLSGALLSTSPRENQAPVVDAGPDRTIFDVQTADLHGGVVDDGLPRPPSLVSTIWTLVGGPAGGAVTFGDASSPETTAAFTILGDYVLRLTANDGELESFDDLIVTVEETPVFVTRTFQDGVEGYAQTRDAGIKSDQPVKNYATDDSLQLHGTIDRAALLKWDLGNIPVGERIESVSLTVNVTDRSNDGYQIYAVKRDWREHEVTWIAAASGNSWEIAGVQGSSDRGAEVLGTITAPQVGSITVEFNAAGVAAVQAWVDDPATNFGIVLQNYDNGDGLRLSSREAATATLRPALTVTSAIPNDNTPPVLSPIGDKSIDEGTLLSFAISATDVDPGDPLTYSAADLPAGATFDPGTRTFDWTPSETQDGAYDVTFSVTDGTDTDFETITIIVREVNQPPVMTSIGDKSAIPDTPLNFAVSATDADLVGGLPNTLTYSAADLPPGATFDPSTRTFDWTPSDPQVGTYVVTFSVTDGDLAASQPVTITVGTLALESIGEQSIDEGTLLSFTISATDLSGEPGPLVYSADGLPPGAVFDPDARTFAWTPLEDQDGQYSVTFAVTNGIAFAAETITITVHEVNQPPVPAPIGDRSVDEGSLLSFTVSATDADLVGGLPNTLTYSASDLPAGAFFDPNTRAFGWIPGEDQDGTYFITLTVSDGADPVAETVTVTVGEVNQSPSLAPIGDRSARVGNLLSFTISATDADLVDGLPDTLAFSAADLPAGATFDPNTRTFAWTPSAGQVGTHAVILSVSDGEATDSETITITVVESSAPITAFFQDGVSEGGSYLGTRDTKIKLARPTKNYGTDEQLEADGDPWKAILIGWDLGSIAPGSTVEFVSLTFDITGKTDDAYEVYALARDWLEHEATWEESSAGSSWETAGVLGAGDRGFTVLGTIVSPSTGPATFELNAAGIARVQSWIDDPSGNFGFIIQDYSSASDGLDLTSREMSVATNRPKLSITYRAVDAVMEEGG